MSNHSGGYMLNEVLQNLDAYKIFDFLGKEQTLLFLKKIRKIGVCYDCNGGEILGEMGDKLKICYGCWNYVDSLEYGLCKKCG